MKRREMKGRWKLLLSQDQSDLFFQFEQFSKCTYLTIFSFGGYL